MSGSLAVPLDGHPQRRRRQRLGHRDGAGDGPPAGRAAPTPCPAASSSSPSRARSAGLLGSQHYVEHPLYPARHDGDDGQLRHGRPAQRQGRVVAVLPALVVAVTVNVCGPTVSCRPAPRSGRCRRTRGRSRSGSAPRGPCRADRRRRRPGRRRSARPAARA